MQRRLLLRTLLAAAALLAASGHTPYRQWAVYRRKHLLILSLRGDGSYPQAKALAEHLLAILPESAARVTRAPRRERVASLLASGQLQVALLDPALATALASGTAGEAIPLTLLGEVRDYWLVAHGDFHPNHAYRVVAALDQAGEEAPLQLLFPEAALLPFHPGVVAYRQGEPAPAPPAPLEEHDHDHDHDHDHAH